MVNQTQEEIKMLDYWAMLQELKTSQPVHKASWAPATTRNETAQSFDLTQPSAAPKQEPKNHALMKLLARNKTKNGIDALLNKGKKS